MTVLVSGPSLATRCLPLFCFFADWPLRVYLHGSNTGLSSLRNQLTSLLWKPALPLALSFFVNSYDCRRACSRRSRAYLHSCSSGLPLPLPLYIYPKNPPRFICLRPSPVHPDGSVRIVAAGYASTTLHLYQHSCLFILSTVRLPQLGRIVSGSRSL